MAAAPASVALLCRCLLRLASVGISASKYWTAAGWGAGAVDGWGRGEVLWS